METTGSESGFGLCSVISLANYTKETDAKLIIYTFLIKHFQNQQEEQRKEKSIHVQLWVNNSLACGVDFDSLSFHIMRWLDDVLLWQQSSFYISLSAIKVLPICLFSYDIGNKCKQAKNKWGRGKRGKRNK